MTKEEFKKQVDEAKKVLVACIEINDDIHSSAFLAAMLFVCSALAHSLGMPYERFRKSVIDAVDSYEPLWKTNPSPSSDDDATT